MKSVMRHDFSINPTIDAPRSRFKRDFGHKTTFNAGELIPFLCDPVLPGDTFNVNTTAICRMSTPLHPIMDNLFLDMHYFFVPLRLVWNNSRKFFGERIDPGDSIDYTIPVVSSFVPTRNSLYDYLGLPTGKSMSVNNLPARCYNLIWNEWFRAEQLQDSVVVDLDDGPDTATDYTILNRGKRFDYFTSCLPSPQLGDAVTIPLGVTAPVIGAGAVATFSNLTDTSLHLKTTAADNKVYWDSTPAATGNIYPSTPTGLQADLSDATSATINDLREAFQVQKLLERDARGGTRYSELVRNHFSVQFYDVSYRPEFLGSSSTPININPVAYTAATVGANTYAGELGATAYATETRSGFTKSFVEHGYVFGIASVRADLTYQQGIPRDFLKSTRYDIFWPSLQFLGEQEVTNAEIYYQATTADNDIFGYIPRYDEYRFKNSMITGDFRSNSLFTLDAWHLSQEFSSLPVLGDAFIQEDPPMDRVLQFSTSQIPAFIFDSYISMTCARPMAVHAVPGRIDHF